MLFGFLVGCVGGVGGVGVVGGLVVVVVWFRSRLYRMRYRVWKCMWVFLWNWNVVLVLIIVLFSVDRVVVGCYC